MFRSSGNSIVDINEEDVLLTSDDTEESSSSSRTRKSRLKRAVRSKVDKFSKPNSRICLLLLFMLFFIMITISKITESATFLELIIKADSKLNFLRENPFLDSYIRPLHQSCLICTQQLQHECHDYGGDDDNRLLVYFITTSPENWLNRRAIRETWAPVTNPRPVFITGYSADLSTMDLLVSEAREYQDIIVEDFLDTYQNLTLKTGFILKHFLSLCPQADFLIKTDDDMFVQPALFDELLAGTDTDHLLGQVQVGATPYRNPISKYYLPYWLYNETVLPEFVSGWTYVLPGRRVPEIYSASFTVPLLNLEDVFFTGLVAGKTLNLTMVDDKRFRTKGFKGHNICLYKPLAAFHRLAPKKLLNVWPRVQNLSLEICDNVIEKERQWEEEEDAKNGVIIR